MRGGRGGLALGGSLAISGLRGWHGSMSSYLVADCCQEYTAGQSYILELEEHGRELVI